MNPRRIPRTPLPFAVVRDWVDVSGSYGPAGGAMRETAARFAGYASAIEWVRERRKEAARHPKTGNVYTIYHNGRRVREVS